MNALTSELINKIVTEQITTHQLEISDHLFQGIDDSMTTEKICSKLVTNSVNISVQLSVKILLELLFESKLIEEADTKTLLKQLSSYSED